LEQPEVNRTFPVCNCRGGFFLCAVESRNIAHNANTFATNDIWPHFLFNQTQQSNSKAQPLLHKFYKIALVALAILALALLLLSPISPIPLMPDRVAPEIVRTPIETRRPNLKIMKAAHRGASKFAPENTLPALEKAIELGFEYIELDVRETRDGIPVLMHDNLIDRTTNGSGQLSDFNLEELKKLDAGTWFSEEFAGTRIPTLEEALQLIKGRACKFWDTKGHPNGAKTAVKLFKKYGFDRDCLLISFGGLGYRGNPTYPKQILKEWPEAPFVVRANHQEELPELLAAYPSARAVSIPRTKLATELVDLAHTEGLLVFSITLVQSDHHHTYKLMMDKGVDIFMLDHIDSFYSYLETEDLDSPPAEPLSTAGYFNKGK
jgi:glycerophosphoryl diester phosphodiesterase